jgi:hypothetical protein
VLDQKVQRGLKDLKDPQDQQELKDPKVHPEPS